MKSRVAFGKDRGAVWQDWGRSSFMGQGETNTGLLQAENTRPTDEINKKEITHFWVVRGGRGSHKHMLCLCHQACPLLRRHIWAHFATSSNTAWQELAGVWEAAEEEEKHAFPSFKACSVALSLVGQRGLTCRGGLEFGLWGFEFLSTSSLMQMPREKGKCGMVCVALHDPHGILWSLWRSEPTYCKRAYLLFCTLTQNFKVQINKTNNSIQIKLKRVQKMFFIFLQQYATVQSLHFLFVGKVNNQAVVIS